MYSFTLDQLVIVKRTLWLDQLVSHRETIVGLTIVQAKKIRDVMW
jgi:hypothetical protein